MTSSTALRHPIATPGRRRMAPGWLILLAVSAAMSIAAQESLVTVAVIAAIAFFAALVGNLAVELCCFGLCVTFGLVGAPGAPYGLLVPVAIAAGTALRASQHANQHTVRGPIALVLLTIGAAAYWFADPPSTNAGTAPAYALVVIPACLVVLRWAVAQARETETATFWFAAGVSVSVGAGLVQSYQSVGDDYRLYETVRVFESTIGSSNNAAALAAIVGALLVPVALAGGGRRWVLLLVAIPFLAAPLVFASRGALVSLAVGAAVWALHSQRGRRNRRALRTLVLIVGVTALAMVAEDRGWFIWRRISTRDLSGEYLSGRVELWEATLGMFLNHPLTGVGPGHVADVLLRDFQLAYAHNTYLEILAQLGLLAGVLYMYLVRPVPLLRWSPAVPALVVIIVNSAIEPVISTPVGAFLYAGLATCHLVGSRDRGRS